MEYDDLINRVQFLESALAQSQAQTQRTYDEGQQYATELLRAHTVTLEASNLLFQRITELEGQLAASEARVQELTARIRSLMSAPSSSGGHSSHHRSRQ